MGANRKIALGQREILMEKLAPEEKKRLESCSGHGSAWLRGSAATGQVQEDLEVEMARAREPRGGWALPRERLEASTLRVDDDKAVAMMRFRLGLETGRGKDGSVCGLKARTTGRKCTERRTDAHALECPNRGWLRNRHDNFAGLLMVLILCIPGSVVKWVPKDSQWRRGGEPGEPDLRLLIPGCRAEYVDVTCIKPKLTRNGVAQAGCGAKAAEAVKHSAYPGWLLFKCLQNDRFTPCAIEHYGRLGTCAEGLIKRLAGRCAQDFGIPQSPEVARWREMLSLRIQLDNARIILARGGP
jgi:hypothetical protein